MFCGSPENGAHFGHKKTSVALSSPTKKTMGCCCTKSDKDDLLLQHKGSIDYNAVREQVTITSFIYACLQKCHPPPTGVFKTLFEIWTMYGSYKTHLLPCFEPEHSTANLPQTNHICVFAVATDTVATFLSRTNDKLCWFWLSHV